MLTRLLLVVEDTPSFATTASWTLELARALSARLFALCTIPTAEAEERAWSMLYELEDDAFAMGVRISLLLEQGEAMLQVITASNDYSIDAVIISIDSSIQPTDLIKRSLCPVVVVKSPRRCNVEKDC